MSTAVRVNQPVRPTDARFVVTSVQVSATHWTEAAQRIPTVNQRVRHKDGACLWETQQRDVSLQLASLIGWLRTCSCGGLPQCRNCERLVRCLLMSCRRSRCCLLRCCSAEPQPCQQPTAQPRKIGRRVFLLTRALSRPCSSAMATSAPKYRSAAIASSNRCSPGCSMAGQGLANAMSTRLGSLQRVQTLCRHGHRTGNWNVSLTASATDCGNSGDGQWYSLAALPKNVATPTSTASGTGLLELEASPRAMSACAAPEDYIEHGKPFHCVLCKSVKVRAT